MNILYILQQSIYNSSGQWLSSDSNINMFLDLTAELYEKEPKIVFYCLIAPIEDFADIKSYTEIYNKPNVKFIPYNFPVDAFTNRYNFDPKQFMQAWNKACFLAGERKDWASKHERGKIDLVWNNIIELTRNIKTALWPYHDAKNIPIISCNYWLDAPCISQNKVDKAISYDWRQFDGAECSDLVAFTCESTKQAWYDNALLKFGMPYITKILNKSTIWDFGYKQSNIITNNKRFEIPTILFLNRLSGIGYTHHEEFIKAVNSLYEKRQDFQVFFTNPSQKVSTEWLVKNVKPYKHVMETPLTRDQYFQLLSKSHISCNLFKIELYGGCSHREAVASGLIPITPNLYEYARIQGDDYNYYCKDDFSDLEKVLSKVIDHVYKGWYEPAGGIGRDSNYEKIKGIYNRNYKSSFEYNANTVLWDLRRLVSEKLM